MDKALYLLAEFDQATQEGLAALYQTLGVEGRQTKDIPYHLTLGSRPCGEEVSMAQELAMVCTQTDCIEVRMDHLGFFGLHCLFVEPNMNRELLTLRNRFFPQCGKGVSAWTAHATLLIDEPEKVTAAIPIAAAHFEPWNARIEAVSLYEFFPTRFITRCILQ